MQKILEKLITDSGLSRKMQVYVPMGYCTSRNMSMRGFLLLSFILGVASDCLFNLMTLNKFILLGNNWFLYCHRGVLHEGVCKQGDVIVL